MSIFIPFELNIPDCPSSEFILILMKKFYITLRNDDIWHENHLLIAHANEIFIHILIVFRIFFL